MSPPIGYDMGRKEGRKSLILKELQGKGSQMIDRKEFSTRDPRGKKGGKKKEKLIFYK